MPRPMRVHPWHPDGNGDCWCSLPESNRCHAQPQTDPRDAAILGERDDEDQEEVA